MSFLKSKSRGVTLIELSIVLAILGVLIIATISGRSLIEISRATATMQQLKDRAVAFQVFSTTYDCLPGDCYDATVKISGLTAGANGNGSAVINFAVNSSVENEIALVEYHLVAARLFNRTIVQTAPILGATAADNDLAKILPTAKVSSAFISTVSIGSTINTVYNVVAAVSQANNTTTTKDLVNATPVDAATLRIIDTKSDDSVANTGMVQCASAFDTTTGALTGILGVTYAADYTANCALVAKMDF